jgi:hypothetical protein
MLLLINLVGLLLLLFMSSHAYAGTFYEEASCFGWPAKSENFGKIKKVTYKVLANTGAGQI